MPLLARVRVESWVINDVKGRHQSPLEAEKCAVVKQVAEALSAF